MSSNFLMLSDRPLLLLVCRMLDVKTALFVELDRNIVRKLELSNGSTS